MLENEASIDSEENLNIETTIEEKDVIAENIEEILEEEILEEEIEEMEEETETESKGFVKELLAGVLDQIVVMASSLVVLLVFNLILKIFGYYVAEKQPMFLIIYVIINVIYGPICRKFKLKETVGRKVLLNK